MEVSPQRLQPIRSLLAAVLWAAAAVGVGVMLVGHRDPTGVRSVLDTALGLLWTGVVVLAVGGVIAALLWPPFVPWLKLRWRRMHEHVDHDAVAVREAAARLQHFENAPDRLTMGKELLARRDFAGAVSQLERAVELDPESLSARQLLGRALLGAGRTEEAVRSLREVVARDEDHAFGDSLRLLGEALADAGDEAEAERILARHEQRFGPLRSVDVRRAELAARRAETDRARALLERAAAKPDGERKLSPEEELARGRARVRLWLGGGKR